MKFLILLVIIFLNCAAEKKLVLLQSLWRHGDRSPTETFPTDPYQEDSWKFGGGGWGQLSPKGMEQHMELGMKLRKRYVEDQAFLSKHYNSKEIYIRSSDVNRTIISAMSNMIGMYSQNQYNNTPNLDYPENPAWPKGYVPIAVHTVDPEFDHIDIVDGDCPLQDEVWASVKKTKEVAEFINRTDVQEMLRNLTGYCNVAIDIDNLWMVTQALLVDMIYHNDTIQHDIKWFSYDLYNRANEMNNQVQLFQNGIFKNPNIVNGNDYAQLLRQLRGGSMVNEMMKHIDHKIACIKDKNNSSCKWMNNLKYYAYSAHDTTLFAYMTALNITHTVINPDGGYPSYSACVLLELYHDDTDDQYYFKMLYHQDDTKNFTEITSYVGSCGNDEYCSVDNFRTMANWTKPKSPIWEWCNTHLNGVGSLTSMFYLIGLLASLRLFY